MVVIVERVGRLMVGVVGLGRRRLLPAASWPTVVALLGLPPVGLSVRSSRDSGSGIGAERPELSCVPVGSCCAALGSTRTGYFKVDSCNNDINHLTIIDGYSSLVMIGNIPAGTCKLVMLQWMEWMGGVVSLVSLISLVDDTQ